MKKFKWIAVALLLALTASTLTSCAAYVQPVGYGPPGPYYYRPWRPWWAPATRHCWVTPWGAWRCGWW